MTLVADGLGNDDVAEGLGVTEFTAKELLLRARVKMGADNRVQAARMWWEAERECAKWKERDEQPSPVQ